MTVAENKMTQIFKEEFGVIYQFNFQKTLSIINHYFYYKKKKNKEFNDILILVLKYFTYTEITVSYILLYDLSTLST